MAGRNVSVGASVGVGVASGIAVVAAGVGVSTSRGVSVDIGRDVGVFVEGRNGMGIAFKGSNKFTISPGSSSGLYLAAATTPTARSNRNTNRTGRVRRPFLFLRLGLKTGASSKRGESLERGGLELGSDLDSFSM